MTSRFRVTAFGFAFALLFLVADCSGESNDDGPGAGPTSTPVPVADQRIVYVSDDYAVFTTTSEGRNRRRVVGAGAGLDGVQARLIAVRSQEQPRVRYTWPTWSPDGTRVAVSRAPGADAAAVASLVLIEEGASAEKQLHETRNGPVPQVAAGTYHYTYWSPDGEQIGLIAPREGSRALSLFQLSPDEGISDEVIRHAPLYVSWAPDSSSLLVHRREQLFIHNASTGETKDLDRPSLAYRVPDFNSDGTEFAYVADGRLRVRDTDTGEEREVLRVGIEAAFMYSPIDPHLLAVTQRGLRTGGGYADLDLVDTRQVEATKLFGGGLLAFYWSPDGSKIMLATGPPVDGLLEWRITDLETGVITDLMRFAPSAGFLPHLQFFDQFAPSHQLWSGDSSRFVFSGHTSSEPGQTSRVWMVDPSGLMPPLEVGRGSMAYWVPPIAD